MVEGVLEPATTATKTKRKHPLVLVQLQLCSTKVGNGRGRKMVDEGVEGEEREVGWAPVGSCEQGGQHLVHLQDTFARKDQKKEHIIREGVTSSCASLRQKILVSPSRNRIRSEQNSSGVIVLKATWKLWK